MYSKWHVGIALRMITKCNRHRIEAYNFYAWPRREAFWPGPVAMERNNDTVTQPPFLQREGSNPIVTSV
jgi:hypothetical protein